MRPFIRGQLLSVILSAVSVFSGLSSVWIDHSEKFKSLNISSDWMDTNCVVWRVGVYAVDEQFNGGEVMLTIGAVPHCGGSWELDTIGSTTNFYMQAMGNVDSIRLIATNLVLTDVSGSIHTADIDLVCTAKGELDRQSSRWHWKRDGIRGLHVAWRIITEADFVGRVTFRPSFEPIGGDSITLDLDEFTGSAEIWSLLGIDKVIVVPSPQGNQ